MGTAIEETQPGPDGKTEDNPAFQRMEAMDEATFKGLVHETEAANRFVAASLLAEPSREPDKVKRARLVSAYLYGLQWWLRDAYYGRLRKAGEAVLDD